MLLDELPRLRSEPPARPSGLGLGYQSMDPMYHLFKSIWLSDGCHFPVLFFVHFCPILIICCNMMISCFNRLLYYDRRSTNCTMMLQFFYLFPFPISNHLSAQLLLDQFEVRSTTVCPAQMLHHPEELGNA